MVYRRALFKWSYAHVKQSSSRYQISELDKTYNDAVYPQLPFLIKSKRIKLRCRHDNNPSGQLYSLTFTLTQLFSDERIVTSFGRATEVRPHAERLIVEAMRFGDKHRPTMELANFWLREKSLIHKLFKVFVPRYENYNSSFTAIHRLGPDYADAAKTLTEIQQEKIVKPRMGYAVLELRENLLPPIIRPRLPKSGLLTNVLLDGARERFFAESASQSQAPAPGSVSEST